MLISKYRKEKKITQKALAQMVNITPAYLCELEKGRKKNPSFNVISKIADTLGVSIDDLMKAE